MKNLRKNLVNSIIILSFNYETDLATYLYNYSAHKLIGVSVAIQFSRRINELIPLFLEGFFI